MLDTLAGQEFTQGRITHLIADTVFCIEENMRACDEAQVTAQLALARENHHPGCCERHAEPSPLPKNRRRHK